MMPKSRIIKKSILNKVFMPMKGVTTYRWNASVPYTEKPFDIDLLTSLNKQRVGISETISDFDRYLEEKRREKLNKNSPHLSYFSGRNKIIFNNFKNRNNISNLEKEETAKKTKEGKHFNGSVRDSEILRSFNDPKLRMQPKVPLIPCNLLSKESSNVSKRSENVFTSEKASIPKYKESSIHKQVRNNNPVHVRKRRSSVIPEVVVRVFKNKNHLRKKCKSYPNPYVLLRRLKKADLQRISTKEGTSRGSSGSVDNGYHSQEYICKIPKFKVNKRAKSPHSNKKPKVILNNFIVNCVQTGSDNSLSNLNDISSSDEVNNFIDNIRHTKHDNDLIGKKIVVNGRIGINSTDLKSTKITELEIPSQAKSVPSFMFNSDNTIIKTERNLIPEFHESRVILESKAVSIPEINSQSDSKSSSNFSRYRFDSPEHENEVTSTQESNSITEISSSCSSFLNRITENYSVQNDQVDTSDCSSLRIRKRSHSRNRTVKALRITKRRRTINSPEEFDDVPNISTTTKAVINNRKRGRPRKQKPSIANNDGILPSTFPQNDSKERSQKKLEQVENFEDSPFSNILISENMTHSSNLSADERTTSPEVNINLGIAKTYSKSSLVQKVFVPPEVERIIEDTSDPGKPKLQERKKGRPRLLSSSSSTN